ncbi:class I SAM-dependent methyltransferase [Patescibacteria group bacterium]|nr:class I SAM-dependent methyltransferase [Patescibacteria group bacterium]MBU4056609.1 class I SAM-dependent methyltransferase [Patescibacteria group bacterium]MBU4369045.1 class I SAM-dependent methyltransferase [Patescibacteria group bacterium]
MPNHILSRSKGASGFMDPEKIVNSFGVERGETVADFGSGAGYFAIPLAKKVSAKGKVYAIDILKDSLAIIDAKASRENLVNVVLLQADLEKEKSTTIEDDSVNWVIMANILFQLNNKSSIFREAKRALKPAGKIIVIDWLPGKTAIGPSDSSRISPEQVRIFALSNNLREIKYWFPDPYHYGFIFIK